MAHSFPDPAGGEPFLLTPGPLTTALEVKQAMLKDWGSWDDDFRAMTKSLRTRLLALCGPGAGDYDCVPIQGSGSYCVEAMLGTFVPRDGNVYNYGPVSWRSMTDILEKPLRRLRGMTSTRTHPRGLPVILGEVATSFQRGNKARWLRQGYLRTYRRWPQVRGIVYFDVDMRRNRHADWRLIRPKDGSAVRAYRQLVAKPIFRGRIR